MKRTLLSLVIGLSISTSALADDLVQFMSKQYLTIPLSTKQKRSVMLRIKVLALVVQVYFHKFQATLTIQSPPQKAPKY